MSSHYCVLLVLLFAQCSPGNNTTTAICFSRSTSAALMNSQSSIPLVTTSAGSSVRQSNSETISPTMTSHSAAIEPSTSSLISTDYVSISSMPTTTVAESSNSAGLISMLTSFDSRLIIPTSTLPTSTLNLLSSTVVPSATKETTVTSSTSVLASSAQQVPQTMPGSSVSTIDTSSTLLVSTSLTSVPSSHTTSGSVSLTLIYVTQSTAVTSKTTSSRKLPVSTTTLLVSTPPPTSPSGNTGSTTEPSEMHFPLFYVIVIVSIGAALLCGILSLSVYLLCLRVQRRNRRKVRGRRDSERVSLYNLERMSSCGSSSQASTDGHELSVYSKTEVVLRKQPSRNMSETTFDRRSKHLSKNMSDTLDRRSSKFGLWLQSKGGLKTSHSHTPTMSCSSFKPNQQLYLPHIQVEVHVNSDLTALTPESRVGSFTKLNEADLTDTPSSTECPTPRPPSAGSGDSIIDKMLHTR